MANQSDFEFELIGFPGISQDIHVLLSLAMFIVYNITLISNGAVIVLIILKETLYQPMYIMICNLALSNLLFDTVTLPKFIAKYWSDGGKISFLHCFTQMYFVHLLTGVDAFILMLMAFDRYVAICRPLRYSSIITHKVTVLTCECSWLAIALVTLGSVIIIKHLFCGSNKIINFFCNSSTVLRLACGEVKSTQEILLIIGLVVLLGPLAFIILSYIIIIWSILLSSHLASLKKAFSTCSTHLLVITFFYSPRVFVYIANYTRLSLNADLSVLLIFLYSDLPHLANPILYCLRTEKIKRIIASVLRKQT